MKKAKILIVEDEAIIAMEIENQLQSLGYEVISIVDTGDEAIKKAEEDKPNLILMDIRIKGEMDGIDAAEQIRNRFGIPVIFSTAYLDQERIERAKITMPFGYVLKPIQERDLKVTLEMALYVAKVDGERRKAENETIKLNQTLKAAQEMAKVGYWSYNIESQMPTWSRQMFLVCGYDPDEAVPTYEEHKLTWHPDDWEMFDKAVQGCAEGKPYNIVVRIRFSDNAYHFVNTQGFPRYDENGTITELYGTSQDITHFKAKEEALKESEQLLKEVVNSMEKAIAVYEPVSNGEDFRFVETNKFAGKIMQFKSEDVIGKTIKELFPGEPSVGLIEMLKETFLTGNSSYIPLKQYKDNRITQWVENYIFKLPSGKVVAMFEDTTERRKAEE